MTLADALKIAQEPRWHSPSVIEDAAAKLAAHIISQRKAKRKAKKPYRIKWDQGSV